MMDIKALQKRAYANKVAKGFNVTDVYQELNFIHQEISELFLAYLKKKDDLGEELADVMIYLLGLAEILKVDLETELQKKIEKNERREYGKNNKGILERTKEG